MTFGTTARLVNYQNGFFILISNPYFKHACQLAAKVQVGFQLSRARPLELASRLREAGGSLESLAEPSGQ